MRNDTKFHRGKHIVCALAAKVIINSCSCKIMWKNVRIFNIRHDFLVKKSSLSLAEKCVLKLLC